MKNGNGSRKRDTKRLKDELAESFYAKKPITSIIHKLVTSIDDVLVSLFQKHQLNQNSAFCLLALGSFGRRELSLYSDIDLMLLHDETISSSALQQAQSFIQDCWDAGLEVSQQITTVNACAELAKNDLSVISSILDLRLVCGRSTLMEELLYQTHPLHMWSSAHYFSAKQQEQIERYKKYGETAYNLEPNVKSGAGGLRDIQVLLNISKRHFGIKKFAEGIFYGFITQQEYDELINCLHFLWRVRFALHCIAGKKDDRLLFDYQLKLAQLFGYQNTSDSLAIEKFMKSYFNVIKRSRELNEVLLQWYSEAIVYQQKQILSPLDRAFQLSNDYIEARHPRIFLQNPQNLLNIFLWIAKKPEIKGVRANTVRLIRQHLCLIDKRFNQTYTATKTFMAILKTGYSPYDALHRMSRYGVLGYYLDSFASVTGQMQYDLFHAYTVDQHTLFVIRNLGRFLKENYKKHPLCSRLMTRINKPHILYLAALFHDIAKGRGGDHSELGALEAQRFALRHALAQDETDLLVWLVRHHLFMSQTAQRQDIYDPKTIHNFCAQLPQAYYLEYLYLLTVADICATNPTLWNAWKDSLLKELYFAAHQAMEKKQTLLDESALVTLRRREAAEILQKENIDLTIIENLWEHFKSKYFLHEPPKVIARHTKAILNSPDFPLVLIMPHHSEGGTEVFIYMPHRDDRFAITTTILNNYGVTIQEATILTCSNDFDLDTYIILDEKNQAFLNKAKSEALQQALISHLADKTEKPNIKKRRLSRAQAHFNLNPQISFSDEQAHQSRLFLVTADRPGLLARISYIFLKQNIHLHNAKIATAGERVEDVFHISNQNGASLNLNEQENLKKALMDHF